MYLYFQQIEDLLKIIDGNQCIISGGFDSDFVTQEDKNMLLKYGVDFNKLLIKNGKTVFNPFNFAMLAESIKELEKLIVLMRHWKYLLSVACIFHKVPEINL